MPAQGGRSCSEDERARLYHGTDTHKLYADDCLVTRVKENPVCPARMAKLCSSY